MSPGEPLPAEVFAELLAEESAARGVPVSQERRDSLARYLEHLDAARRTTNLTGPLTPAELAFHVVESVLGERLLPSAARVVDIGSGAGLPGIPLAIARPDVSMTLVEPRRLRAEFLRHAVRAIPLSHTAVRQERAEKLEPGRFDAVTARAVGRLPELLDGGRFLAPRGRLVAWTTAPDELARSLEPAFALEEVLPVAGTDRRVIARLIRR